MPPSIYEVLDSGNLGIGVAGRYSGNGPLSEHVSFEIRSTARYHVQADPAWSAFLELVGTAEQPRLERPQSAGEPDEEPQGLA
jgi:hypothetical protein